MIRKIFISFGLLCAVAIQAQDDFNRINEIKRSEVYMWEQFSHESADTASLKACQGLLQQLQATDPNLTMADLEPFIQQILIKRETITRAFVYINPADLTKPSTIVPQQNLAQEIMKCKDFSQVYYELMPKVQQNGQVLDFGGMKGIDDIDKRYIIIFDKEDPHVPLAVLSPERNEMGMRGNLASHAEENLSDYRGYPALWFRIKEQTSDNNNAEE